MRTLAALLVAALIWAAGLFAFADRVGRLTPAPLPAAADGVVVLTGAGSNARLDRGMAVLEAGLARRLLVSGVNREASREAMRFRSLVVVTADYHMPRAMLELKSALPDTRLEPYAAATPVVDARRWWRTRAGARLMIREYSKYMTVLGREMVRRLGPAGDPARKDPP